VSAIIPSDAPVTTTPQSTTRSWRAAAIALVAALAVGIGAALGAFLLDGRGAGIGTAGSYVPDDAALYVEARLEPSADQDAALRELLGRFPPIDGIDLDGPLAESLAARMDELLAGEGAAVSWASDVAPWFDGRVAIAVTDAALTASSSGATAIPDSFPGVILLGVTDRAAAEGAIERLLAEIDPALEFTDAPHGDFTIRETTEGAYALTNDQLILGTSAGPIRSALDAHASGSSLTQSGQIESFTAALPDDWLAFGVYDLSGIMADALTQLGTESPDTVGPFEALFENLPTRLAFSVSASGEGLLMDAVSDLPTGPFAPENGDRGLADEVPGDALFYAEAGNVGPALAALIEALKASLAGDPAIAEQIRRAELALDADLGELVSWVGDGAIAIGWDGSEPYAGLVLVPTDVATAERRLGQLRAFAELAALDPSSGVTVTEADVASETVTTIAWESPPELDSELPAATGLVLEYVVTDERAIVGVGDAFVRRVLALEEPESLAAQPRFTDAIATLGGATNAGVTWLDLAGTREAIEEALGTVISSMDADGAYASEIRPWLVPLDRLASVSRIEGDRLVTHAVLILE
jgi:Protein of unknown function (DUF3352)